MGVGMLRLATTRVAARSGSEGTRPPLLVLHGLLGSAGTYGTLLRRADCAPQSEKVAVDLAGHGRSPHAVDRLAYPAMAADVGALATPRADIVGHSMGGKAAMALALLHPASVRRIVVVDVAPVAYKPPGTADAPMGVPRVAAHAMQAIAREGLADGRFPRRGDVDEELRRRGVEDPNVRAFVCTNLVVARDGPKGAWNWRCDVDGIVEALPRLVGFDIGPDGDGRHFDGPALFVAGGRSRYIDKKHSTVIKERFPRAVVRTLDHCGHWLQAEDPEAFCELLNEFLDGD